MSALIYEIRCPSGMHDELPGAHTYVCGQLCAIVSLHAGTWHLSVSHAQRAPTDDEVCDLAGRILPGVVVAEERGPGSYPHVRHLREVAV